MKNYMEYKCLNIKNYPNKDIIHFVLFKNK